MMNIDPGILIAASGAIASIAAAWGAHSMTIKMVSKGIEDKAALLAQSIHSLEQRWVEANAARNEQLGEMRGDIATHDTRIELNVRRVAVLEARLGLSPYPRKEDAE